MICQFTVFQPSDWKRKEPNFVQQQSFWILISHDFPLCRFSVWSCAWGLASTFPSWENEGKNSKLPDDRNTDFQRTLWPPSGIPAAGAHLWGEHGRHWISLGLALEEIFQTQTISPYVAQLFYFTYNSVISQSEKITKFYSSPQLPLSTDVECPNHHYRDAAWKKLNKACVRRGIKKDPAVREKAKNPKPSIDQVISVCTIAMESNN